MQPVKLVVAAHDRDFHSEFLLPYQLSRELKVLSAGLELAFEVREGKIKIFRGKILILKKF